MLNNNHETGLVTDFNYRLELDENPDKYLTTILLGTQLIGDLGTQDYVNRNPVRFKCQKCHGEWEILERF
jgi:hypothetical protein